MHIINYKKVRKNVNKYTKIYVRLDSPRIAQTDYILMEIN